jgi:hypothetical protein
MKKYVYFVSYKYNDGSGFCDVEIDGEIKNIEVLKTMAKKNKR